MPSIPTTDKDLALVDTFRNTPDIDDRIILLDRNQDSLALAVEGLADPIGEVAYVAATSDAMTTNVANWAFNHYDNDRQIRTGLLRSRAVSTDLAERAFDTGDHDLMVESVRSFGSSSGMVDQCFEKYPKNRKLHIAAISGGAASAEQLAEAFYTRDEEFQIACFDYRNQRSNSGIFVDALRSEHSNVRARGLEIMEETPRRDMGVDKQIAHIYEKDPEESLRSRARKIANDNNIELPNLPIWSLQEGIQEWPPGDSRWTQSHPYGEHRSLTHFHGISRVSVPMIGNTWGDLKRTVREVMNTAPPGEALDRRYRSVEGFFVNGDGQLETLMGS